MNSYMFRHLGVILRELLQQMYTDQPVNLG